MLFSGSIIPVLKLHFESSSEMQAVKDDVGTLRIQRPLKGPFYVSHKNIDQLIANLGKWARLFTISQIVINLFHNSLVCRLARYSYIILFLFSKILEYFKIHEAVFIFSTAPTFFFYIFVLNVAFDRWYKYAVVGFAAFGFHQLHHTD